MDTKEQLVILAEIGRYDLKLLLGRDKLSRLNTESDKAKQQALTLKQSIEQMQEQKEEAIKRKRQLDEKLLLEKSNLRKWEARAEKIKGEREYTALMSEIGSQKRVIFGVESEMSELSSEIKLLDEKLLKASGAHDQKLGKAEEAFGAVKDLLGEEESLLKEILNAKKVLLDKLPKDVRMRYQRIYDKRAEQGVAFLVNHICQACRRMVPPELFIRVQKAEVVEQCPSCQRMVVIEPETT